jgi:hypothetical protein
VREAIPLASSVIRAITTGFLPIGMVLRHVGLTLLTCLGYGFSIKIFVAYPALTEFRFSFIALMGIIGVVIAHLVYFTIFLFVSYQSL